MFDFYTLSTETYIWVYVRYEFDLYLSRFLQSFQFHYSVTEKHITQINAISWVFYSIALIHISILELNCSFIINWLFSLLYWLLLHRIRRTAAPWSNSWSFFLVSSIPMACTHTLTYSSQSLAQIFSELQMHDQLGIYSRCLRGISRVTRPNKPHFYSLFPQT